MREAIAAHAARAAFYAARAAAGHDIAVEVALARYRAFFPLARRQEIRLILACAVTPRPVQASALRG
jgi:hypothetical protein